MFVSYVIFFIYSVLVLCTYVNGAVTYGYDESTSVRNMVRDKGYPLEEHHVVTEDGSILMVHRVPYGLNEKSTSKEGRPVVLLVHGGTATSGHFLIGNATNSIGFVLPDNGFDVWLPNLRGNVYSRNHTWLDPMGQKFWEFSCDEVGEYDIPAVMDYIIKATGQTKLNYIGHSMGNTAFFMAMSIKPKYNANINHMITWAPAVFMGNQKSFLLGIQSRFYKMVNPIYTMVNGNGELLNRDSFPSMIFRHVYRRHPWFWLMLFKSQYGGNLTFLNEEVMDAFLDNSNVGISIDAACQFAQFVATGRFQHYDRGRAANMMRYGRVTPPDYNLSLVTAPVTIFEAKDDPFGRNENVDRLQLSLPNVKERYVIKRKSFGHLSFMTAKDAYEQAVLPTVLRLMKYNGMKMKIREVVKESENVMYKVVPNAFQ